VRGDKLKKFKIVTKDGEEIIVESAKTEQSLEYGTCRIVVYDAEGSITFTSDLDSIEYVQALPEKEGGL